MGIEQTVIEKLRALPPQKQQEVLDFVEFLQQKNRIQRQIRLKGLWADLSIDITEADITQARREMWRNFPQESF